MSTELDHKELEFFISNSLKEDVGPGDFTSEACIDEKEESYAELLVKDDGIIAGIEFARAVFEFVDTDIVFDQKISDGDKVKYGDIAFTIRGSSRSILKGERLALNTMQRLSGVATMSHQYADIVKDLKVTILDTRKTTPLMRFLEKWAVRLGGSSNYRDGLYDWIMIKDNHIDASGSITQAVTDVKSFLKEKNLDLDMTVEVRNHEELVEVLNVGGVRRIMLDNFTISDTKKAVAFIGDQAEVEASGGITMETLRSVAETGVDFISVGALTHSAPILDLSLKIRNSK